MTGLTVLWIVVTLIAMVAEIATQALVSVWFVVAGFVTMVLAFMGFSLPAQLICFFVVSIFSFSFIRRYLIPYTQVKVVPTNADRLIGQEAQVTKELPARGRGEVKINGQFWTALCDDPDLKVPVDSRVLIRSIQGATLIVSLIDEE